MAPSRLVGEKAEFDLFLSYRVRSDAAVALRLYELFTTQHGLKVHHHMSTILTRVESYHCYRQTSLTHLHPHHLLSLRIIIINTIFLSSSYQVWLDSKCLEAGKLWEEGFSDGLVKSQAFVAVASRDGLTPFSTLTVTLYTATAHTFIQTRLEHSYKTTFFKSFLV